MKKAITKIINLILCVSFLFGLVHASGCSPEKGALTGTALAEALLSKERINREHLSHSFDFLDNRLNEKETVSALARTQVRSEITQPMDTSNSSGTAKGEIISGSGDNAVYSWSSFERLVTELYYFQSHFGAGQSNTENVDKNISRLENLTDIKNKWVKEVSYIDYLMVVDSDREIIYTDDTINDTYSVGIRKVNNEINTTYEYYENQGNSYIRTLATPDRRYEYSTVSGEEVMSFVADNDNGYWRFTQLYSWKGESVSLSVLIMIDDLAYFFTYNITEGNIYNSNVQLISPDLKYEIAELNESQITIYPGSYTGIKELRVSQEEQNTLGEYGSPVAYTEDYGYYSSNAMPHIYTSKGELRAPKRVSAEGGGSKNIPTPLDEKVGYINGNVSGLWEQVYPHLVFEVAGNNVSERLDNLHAALSKYDIEPIYNKNTVGKMATDVLKLVDGYNEHYTWNGEVLSTYENTMKAYEKEKAKADVYDKLFSDAQELPTASKRELLEVQENAGFPSLTFALDASVSVDKGKINLNGLSATVEQSNLLEKEKDYVLKLALKKNTEELEELVVLGNLNQDNVAKFSGETLSLSLSGEFNLPTDIAPGEYDVVAFAATADNGIRVSKFKRVLCVGNVNDEVTLENMKINTTITADKILRSQYKKIFDVSITLKQVETPYTCEQVIGVIENEIMNKGYFLPDATLEVYNTSTHTGSSVSGETLLPGIYRLEYLGQSDGGKVVAYIYCEILPEQE